MTNQTPPRFRYLIDIVVLIAAIFGLNFIADAIYTPKTSEAGYVFSGMTQMLQVVIACVLIWFRGETLADIGLKRPQDWPRTIGIGILIAVALFALIYFLERAGFHRDLSRFAELKGNAELTGYAVGYVFIGAGFYEEFMFRGFLMQGLAMCFSGSRGGWSAAIIIQGVVFGFLHAYQNPRGILMAGTLGILSAILVLRSGRNLWPSIIAHALYDGSRCVLIYFQGPPGT